MDLIFTYQIYGCRNSAKLDFIYKIVDKSE